MTEREEIQSQAIKDLFGTGIRAGEIKTGTGKTKILLDIANKHREEGRNVIISTSNIHLVKSFFDEAEKFDYKMPMEILIGKGNYVDFPTVYDPAFHREYGIREEDVKKWADEHYGMFLSELFVKYFSLPEDIVDEISIVDDQSRTLREILSMLIDNESQGKVFVTNHTYLIYLLKYAQKNQINLKNYAFLIDEAHLLDSASKMVFSHHFSLFMLKVGIVKMLNVDKISEAMRKRLVKLKIEVEDIIRFAQQYDSDTENIGTPRELVERIRLFLYGEKIRTAFNFAQKTANDGLIFYQQTLSGMKIFREQISREMIALSFSTIRKLPSFSIEMQNNIFALREVMRHIGDEPIVLVSGTIRISESESVKDNQWSFVKMGLFKYNLNKLVEGSTDEERESKKKHNDRIDTILFRNYPYIFKRSEVAIYCPNEKQLLPPKTNFKKKEELNKHTVAYDMWVSHLADLCSKTCLGNTVCLMSSYENSEMMKKHLIEKLDDYEIIAHQKGDSITSTIERYKRAIDEGNKAVLIGGLSFYTGIDLHGKYLSTLFIGKLPIEPKPSLTMRIPKSLPSIQADIRYKSLITFRQGIGRAKRREGDKVLVVVADPRIHTSKYRHFKTFLSEVGRFLQN